ncbi:MAG: HDOD domain-containing protein [Gammaproteobacteria bacterium]|nr:HDOD domain-containing protein [Gammaproteobacteria bacterium]
MLSLFRTKRAERGADLHPVVSKYELPSFPALILRALEKVRDENAALSEIAELVSADPGLSARLLRTVNSSAYCLRHKVQSIAHAISLLGRGALESMLVAMAVQQILPRPTAAEFDPVRFWRTAARRASVARAVADHVDPSRRSESFTAGLLQDMAIPVLLLARPQEYVPLLRRWYAGDGDLVSLERDAFDWDHGQVARQMCDEWSFPEIIAAAIGAHHEHWTPDVSVLPAVHLVAPLHETQDEPGISQVVEMGESLGLAADQMQSLLDASFDEADEIAQLFA